MSKPLIGMIKLNGLALNPQRDPQPYRRCVGEPFRIEAMLRGSGSAQVRLLDASGATLAEAAVELPGRFACEIAYESAGSRIVVLAAETAHEREERELRLDVLERRWIG